MKRYAGVLMSVTSLPSKYGIGCFDKTAYEFVDWLEKAVSVTGRSCLWVQPPTAATTLPTRPIPLLPVTPT